MKVIKFIFFIKVLLGNFTNDYEIGSGRFENQTTDSMQERLIGRSRMPDRKNTNPRYHFSPDGILKGVVNRSPSPKPPSSILSKPRPTKTCNILDLSTSILFEDPSPCRLNCVRANTKCDICKKRRGKQKEICMSFYRKKLKVCERCMENPHKLTQAKIVKIASLNSLKFNDDVVGETATMIPKVKFSIHDVNGKLIRFQSRVEQRILFGWTAKPKEIPWQIQLLNDQIEMNPPYQCGGTLVTPNKIVSAAHCFPKDLPWQSLVAKAGNIERERKDAHVQQRKCSQIITHL